METFFKPLHSPCASDEIEPQEIHHHDHLRLHQDPQSRRHTMFDETNINSDDCLGHFHQHGHSSQILDNPHHDARTYHPSQKFHHSEEDQILYKSDIPVSLCRASSSSPSSSSSAFSSSWYTEASENDTYSLCHAEQPKHSLSCSNITDNGMGFREDDTSKATVFATIKHGKIDNVFSELHTNSQKEVKRAFSSLDRGHSRSDEGQLHGDKNNLGREQPSASHMNYELLHKTGSLNRSLAFSAEDILLGVSRCPQRAVSSSQLPSKGILKNKEPFPDIRKAKSMEVLSTRVSKGQDSLGQKGKAMTHVEIEQARDNFVQGKLQFSAFLDEITKQVISPSDLIILGVNNNNVTEKTLAPAEAYSTVKPQLPPKKHRECTRNDKERHLKQRIREEGVACKSSLKPLDCSYLDKLHSYASKNYHRSPSPPHYPHSTSHTSHHGSNHKGRRQSRTQGFVPGDRYVSWGSHIKDVPRTSPELSQQRQHHNQKQQPAAPYRPHAHHLYQQQPQQVHSGSAVGPGISSESSSTKSDSTMARDTTSTTTSHSKEQGDQHLSQYVGHSKISKDIVYDLDHFRALQEENTDLQQNLLQTVVCIETLEVELQRTRDELSLIKEKYKSLLETHTGANQANILLGKQLHIASETLGSERKYLLNTVSQLTSELENAHRTLAALGNINVPCLIKEILEKHFSSAEAIQKILVIPSPASAPAPAPAPLAPAPAPVPFPISHSSSSLVDGQLYSSKMEEAAHDRLMKSEAGLQRATAFIPVKQGVLTAQNEKLSHSPPLSVADISTAIYEKMAVRYVAKPGPLYLQSQKQPPLGSKPVDCAPNHGVAECLSGKGGDKLTLLEEDNVDVTAVSAQQILDEFIRQLQPHKVGEEKDQRGGQEWNNVGEYIGKGAD